jgi:hypothetical protein
MVTMSISDGNTGFSRKQPTALGNECHTGTLCWRMVANDDLR